MPQVYFFMLSVTVAESSLTYFLYCLSMYLQREVGETKGSKETLQYVKEWSCLLLLEKEERTGSSPRWSRSRLQDGAQKMVERVLEQEKVIALTPAKMQKKMTLGSFFRKPYTSTTSVLTELGQ